MIPFDITNMSTRDNKDLDLSLDFKLEDQVIGEEPQRNGIYITQVMMIIKHLVIAEDG